MDWKYTKENPLRVVTLCSGYDSQLMALRNIGVPYECVAWSEIDQYAIRAHNAVFPEIADRNLGDMTKIDWSKVRDFDLLFYSTPCTDFSNAGKQMGGAITTSRRGFLPAVLRTFPPRSSRETITQA